MSEIPYFFHTPVPKYFRENGLFKNCKNVAFITWCFERCSSEERTIFHDNKLITLKPYQFIFGRVSCVEETGLTDDEIRTQQKRWETAGFLKKAPNKTPNRFTVYEWVMTAFLKSDPQQNPRQTPNRPPTNPHNLEDKIDRSKEDLPSYLPSLDDGIDDFSKSAKEIALIEVYPGVKLSQAELDECIAIKGSLDSVTNAISYIMNCKGRKKKITNWPNAMLTWTIKTNARSRLEENEARGAKLEKEFHGVSGWYCRVYTDRKKDQRGLLFENTASVGNNEPIFITFIDPEFDDKVNKTLRDKKMQKGRIKPN